MKLIIIALLSWLSHFIVALDSTNTLKGSHRTSRLGKNQRNAKASKVTKGKESKGKESKGKNPDGHCDPITEADIEAAQVAWCDALISISNTYTDNGFESAKTLAQTVLDTAYAYTLHVEVLFKPTLASGEHTFRLTNEGALSYFVGGNPNYPDDHGFALKGWTSCHSERAGVEITGRYALSMGNVYFKNANGVTKVDKSWGYLQDDDCALRIVLHHSSLPYEPHE
jgi:hypothetical protein